MDPYYILIGFITLIGIFTAVFSWFMFHIRPTAKRMMALLKREITTSHVGRDVSLHRLVTIATLPNTPPGNTYSNYSHCAHFYDAIHKHPIIWTIFFADRT